MGFRFPNFPNGSRTLYSFSHPVWHHRQSVTGVDKVIGSVSIEELMVRVLAPGW